MSEPGLYALTKVIAGGLSAVLTGPLGSADLPEVDLRDALGGTQSSYAAEIIAPDGERLGWAGHDRPGSPDIHDLPEDFIFALLSIEDAHYGLHPGVDPVAVASAGIDTLRGNRRGGSTITQQLVKNAVTGADLTIERKIHEGILAVRAQHAFPPDELLQAYLAKAWFGRGQKGAAGAALAWFGKPWDEIQLHEAAFLAGLLKGPAYYDPISNPERAKARRDLVIAMMHARKMISTTDMAVAQSLPLEVIPEEEAERIFDQVPHWVSSGIAADLDRYGLMNRSDISSGQVEITTTISTDWQQLAEDALQAGIKRLSPSGPAITLELPAVQYGDPLDEGFEELRQEAANALATTRRTGRAIVVTLQGNTAEVIIDRGYGTLEWDKVNVDEKELGYTPKRGDVLAYQRIDDEVRLKSTPQVQGAIIVMDPQNGAILASIGGNNAELSPFDRTNAKRQPGSSIKPFLWARAMEDGLRFDDLVEDVERDYVQANGQVWSPRNYDHSQSGLIPLFVGLEESSNLVAASLVDQVGLSGLATITELAGVYDWGDMRRHVSSALGASETSLTRMAAGYSALANGGLIVTPHRISKVERDGRILWTPPGAEDEYAIATRRTTDNISSMLYGVTRRGTAYSAFKGSSVPVAGKTGTTEGYRDAWFMSFTPGLVVGVWVGRDDFTPIPGRLSGSRAAAPIARQIYEGAYDLGLIDQEGYRPGQAKRIDWPPRLLEAGRHRVNSGSGTHRQDPFKRDDNSPLLERREGASSGYLQPIEGLDNILNPRSGSNGYLSDNQDRNAPLTRSDSPRSPESGLIFKSPW